MTRPGVYGVDFSGAADAGKKIWVADGTTKGKKLRIETCRRASDFLGAGSGRDECLAALVALIANRKDCAFGLDFPFGLPQPLVGEKDWRRFVLSFPKRYPSSREFRVKCHEKPICSSLRFGNSSQGVTPATSGGYFCSKEHEAKVPLRRELKRATDTETRAPFSPYNLRLYRQTYHGIRDVLHPLVKDDLARVMPMQKAVADKPIVLEICPASTLKRLLWLKQLPSYKGGSKAHRSARAQILEALPVLISGAARSAATEDANGDALDSVVAAYATFTALCKPAAITRRDYLLEGYIFC